MPSRRRWSPDPSRGAGGERDRQITRVSRPRSAQRQEGRRGHRHQGTAGPVGREGPAQVEGRSRPPSTSTTRCSRAGATTSACSGWPRWAPAGSRPSSATRAVGPMSRRRPRRATGAEARPKARLLRPSSRRCASWWPGRRSPRPAIGPTSASSPPIGPGTWSGRPTGVPRRLQLPVGRALLSEAARERASVADVVVVNTHLYRAHLASGSVVLPKYDVVIFDEAHELEEVMTSSLGVEVTPGRFRSLVTSARSLVEQRDADLLDSLASVGDQIGALLGDRVGTRVLHDEARPPVDDANSPSCSRAGPR